MLFFKSVSVMSCIERDDTDIIIYRYLRQLLIGNLSGQNKERRDRISIKATLFIFLYTCLLNHTKLYAKAKCPKRKINRMFRTRIGIHTVHHLEASKTVLMFLSQSRVQMYYFLFFSQSLRVSSLPKGHKTFKRGFPR